ncbi:MAG: trypsin-like peptidase domain-containing protein [Bacillota bacterium]|nr:trypsin-like peptidase domain-containing protein [Bacillota bacterium]
MNENRYDPFENNYADSNIPINNNTPDVKNDPRIENSKFSNPNTDSIPIQSEENNRTNYSNDFSSHVNSYSNMYNSKPDEEDLFINPYKSHENDLFTMPDNQQNTNGFEEQNTFSSYATIETMTKKEKKSQNVTRRSLAIVLCICIVASGLIGFGGGFLANKLMASGSDSGSSVTGSDLTIQRVVDTTAGDDKVNDDLSTSDIVKQTADAVVEIETESVQTGGFSNQYITSGAGSGVIISSDGYILTNHHVISGATKITVTLRDGKNYSAKLVGYDTVVDCALVKINATGLKTVVFGDSDKIVVGQKAVAIGNPLGQLGGTVTDGIISALNRTIVLDNVSMNLIQTNAAINPGNSGGGLFNGKGELVGLVVAKSSGNNIEGLGFAIPINDVANILGDLKKYGYVRGRVELGVSLVDVTSNEMAAMYGVSEQGCYVESVTSDNASKAGVQRGDEIVSINGVKVTTTTELKTQLNKLKVGDTAKLGIVRNSSSLTIGVVLAESKHSSTSDSTDSSSNSSNDSIDNSIG